MSKAGVLIDTSVLIDFLRQNNKMTTWYYHIAATEAKLLISILTHTELYSGKKIWKNARSRNELQELLSAIEILPFSQKISENSGKLRALADIDLPDAIIAATAIESKLPLATLNPRHFKKIPGLHLLKPVLKYKN